MLCRFWSGVCTVVLLMRARLSGLIGPQFWSIDHSDGWLDTSSSNYNNLWPNLQFLFTGGGNDLQLRIGKVNFFHIFLWFFIYRCANQFEISQPTFARSTVTLLNNSYTFQMICIHMHKNKNNATVPFRINVAASTSEGGAKKAPYDVSLPPHKVRATYTT